MRIYLTGTIAADVYLSFEDGLGSWTLLFRDSAAKAQQRPLGFRLSGAGFPEIRYLMILYFFDERIPFQGRAPRALGLEGYRELYEALFGVKCVYTDKNRSMDHFRSAELHETLLKQFQLKFERGGLFRFEGCETDENARARFRGDVLEAFRDEILRRGDSAAAEELTRRYLILRSYCRETPSRYLERLSPGFGRLWEAELKLDGAPIALYRFGRVTDWRGYIEGHRRILVTGESGCGKSTLLACIGLDPDVHEGYNIITRDLRADPHAVTRGDMNRAALNSGRRYLYLIDNFDALSDDGGQRALVRTELMQLLALENTRVIIASQSTHSGWNGFTRAELTGLLPDASLRAADESVRRLLLSTPPMRAAYESLPPAIRGSVRTRYSLLKHMYSSRVKAHIEAGFTGAESEAAFFALLPALGAAMCREGRGCLTEEELEGLLSGSDEILKVNEYLRAETGHMSPAGGIDLRKSLEILLRRGEILCEGGMYSFRYRLWQDYAAARYEAVKLGMICAGESCAGVSPWLNLGSGAGALLREALTEDGLLEGLIKRVNPIDEDSGLTHAAVCAGCALASVYEYVLDRPMRDRLYPEIKARLNGMAAFLNEYNADPVLIESILAGREADRGMLAFMYCRAAELELADYQERVTGTGSLDLCLETADTGLLIDGGASSALSARLGNMRAKVMMEKSVAAYGAGDMELSGALMERCMQLLSECNQNGGFLSGNLLAFFRRAPVPMLRRIIPDIRDPREAFIINACNALDPRHKNVNMIYPRNEAVDALLMGEVKINLFPGLESFSRLLATPGGRERAVSGGRGVCGPKELKLARAILYSRGTPADSFPLTAFYMAAIDCLERTAAGEPLDEVRKKHSAALKNRSFIINHICVLQPMLLYCLNEGLTDDNDYGAELNANLITMAERLESGEGASKPDADHPYYDCRRALYWLNLLAARRMGRAHCQSCRGKNRECTHCAPFREGVRRVYRAVEAFEDGI